MFSSSFGVFVAEQVASVVGEPQLLRVGMPGHADRVAHAARENFCRTAVRLHAPDGGEGVATVADVAGRANLVIEVAIGAEREVLPAVRRLLGQFVDDDFRRETEAVEPAFTASSTLSKRMMRFSSPT